MLLKFERTELIKTDDIPKGSVISVVGCGGKTTLIEYMAAVLSKKFKVGVAASAKMRMPLPGTFDQCFIGSQSEVILPEPGIYYFADTCMKTPEGDKLCGFSGDLKKKALLATDIMLIEADGSAHKPVKAWKEDEPVIIQETTMTIGAAAFGRIGEAADGTTIHRLPLFLSIYPGAVSKTLTRDMFEWMIGSKDGMFKNSRGRAVVWENRAEIAAVVLASGYARRMGANKLMIPVMGKPMIAHVFEALATVSFSKKTVVTNQASIGALAKKYGIDTVFNHHADEGQSRSVVLGTAACMRQEHGEGGKHIDGLMFFPGDMPLVTPDLIRKLMTAFAAAGKEKIIVPVYLGSDQKTYRRGSPVIFPAAFSEALMQLSGDSGGRQILKKYPEKVYEVPVGDGRLGTDIDSSEDLIKLRSRT
ncbi:MAG TPA: putative selenium-dependent hydroxylase accessory protein YqeC [Candidatus Scybalocola faecipullorum]|nr:putative selenium-dependent hydroxylase accessory protein YqeC [Candidatus Scybalocola faecipullorum]